MPMMSRRRSVLSTEIPFVLEGWSKRSGSKSGRPHRHDTAAVARRIGASDPGDLAGRDRPVSRQSPACDGFRVCLAHPWAWAHPLSSVRAALSVLPAWRRNDETARMREPGKGGQAPGRKRDQGCLRALPRSS
jgi:hypothetical protein